MQNNILDNNIYYIGVNDKQIDLFEGQYVVPNGISYNSFVIMDDKITVMDTVDAHFCDEWCQNLEQILNGKQPDYLIVIKLVSDGSWEEVYNGPGKPVWDNAGKIQKNGQRPISLSKLKCLMNSVNKKDVFARVL